MVVLGISADPPQTQKKFQEKYSLPYTLLSDTDKRVCEAYGVIKEKNMYGRMVKGIARGHASAPSSLPTSRLQRPWW